MKHAAAMKYGGELVAAQDCDYDSYLLLGTLCPECKEPVYLKTGGDRVSVKGTPYKIGPYFSHRKGTSEEQIAACEVRVSNYTDKDRQRIAAKAKGQRLKLLHRWFWDVYLNNSVRGKNENDINQLKDSANREIASFKCGYFGDEYFVSNSLIECVHNRVQSLKSAVRNYVVIDVVESLVLKLLGDSGPVDFKTTNDINELFKEGSSVINRRMQNEITIEVLDFLSSKKSFALIKDITILHSLTMSESDMSPFLSNGIEGRDQYAVGVCLSILKRIAFIPWPAEFQRLEDEANERKGKAA